MSPVTAPPPAEKAATVPVTAAVPVTAIVPVTTAASVTAAARASRRIRTTAAPEGQGGTGR